MKTPFVLLTALLAGTVLFLGTIAWRQHSELIRLRAAALDQGDRAALQKRIRDAEKRAQLSEARALAAQPANTETTSEPTDPAATAQLKNLPPADKKGPSPQLQSLSRLAGRPAPEAQPFSDTETLLHAAAATGPGKVALQYPNQRRRWVDFPGGCGRLGALHRLLPGPPVVTTSLLGNGRRN